MATFFDLGLLKEFTSIFAMVLIFAVSFGLLQVVDIFKNRGINALVAISIAIIIGISSSASSVIAGMAPWFVITGFFAFFLIVLARFIGVDMATTAFSGRSGIWWIFMPLIVGLIISLASGGVLQKGGPDEETTPGRAVIEIVTEPKVLGVFLILVIAGITVTLMAGAPRLST